MKRILHCFNGLDNGGVEAFIMSVYRNIDRTKFQFDFLIRDGKHTPYWDEIESMGGKIYVMPPYPQKAISNYFATKKFLKEHQEYDNIHVHANSLFYVSVLKIATKLKFRNRIVHSHSSFSYSWIVKKIHNHYKKDVYRFSNCQIACSKSAGEWMFGNLAFKTIHNGISTKKYRFNNEIRNLIRTELKIENKFVIGHIGRFVNLKNHSFLLDIFCQYQNNNNNAVLLLVGFGPLEKKIRDKINMLNIGNKVIILNDRNDSYNLLQAMDLFLFPSIYEGFGISLLEAQASGLPCVCSSAMPSEVILSDSVKTLSLNESVSTWCREIDLLRDEDIDRSCGAELVKEKGYDVSTTCQQLIEIYNR